MASFRFAFSIDEKDENGSTTNETTSQLAEPKTANQNSSQAADQIKSSSAAKQQQLSLVELPPHAISSKLPYNTIQINNDNSLQAIQESKTCQQVDKTHDVITGVYEGGLKVWECCVDLCRYLLNNQRDLLFQDNTVKRSNKDRISVLELGCGHGLPGCLLLKEWAKGKYCNTSNGMQPKCHVLFSDFNEFVLEHVTAHNINMNTAVACPIMTLEQANCTLVAGDWMALSQALLDQSISIDSKFDLILAAETTYTTASAESTAILFARHLSCPFGVGLVANKRYYFGVGGGSDVFRDAISSAGNGTSCENNGMKYVLHVEVVEEVDNGAGNIREILRVEWKRQT
uniref:protein-histidine N-methyltransferase n=1 Tax=Leptocylindrus danicus TaxID=163516 RepID=A0A7S2L9K5_9STRA|mmetsp:Transcript_33347/g.48245  ORF Transcript_33347/g.48245 Transcript_33347/m.48245 type:complete len:344 (+) Transcript_33347:57-1088(+)